MKGKCHNYSGCLRAYRGEEIEIATGALQICPECGKPVEPISKGGPLLKVLGILLLVGALGAGAYFALPLLNKKGTTTDIPADPSTTQTDEPSSKTTSTPVDRPPSAGTAEPPSAVMAPERVDLDASRAENRQVKSEVLTRIDLMPGVSKSNKDKLYNSVERARSMGQVLTIPFTSGRSSLSSADLEALKKNLDAPQIRKLRDDPTAVFVVLGFADPKGDEKKNRAISQVRADAVINAMRDKCGVVNVMHAVAMGGSTIVDAKNLEKNRIVEIWVVLP